MNEDPSVEGADDLALSLISEMWKSSELAARYFLPFATRFDNNRVISIFVDLNRQVSPGVVNGIFCTLTSIYPSIYV